MLEGFPQCRRRERRWVAAIFWLLVLTLFVYFTFYGLTVYGFGF